MQALLQALAPTGGVEMTYPEVKQAHIVPKCYLRNFADGKKIAVRVVGDAAQPKITSIDKAGTRGPYYRRTRPDGTKFHDVEWSLAQGERAAAHVLREIRERWPLTFEDKSRLASFFGAQFVRGPRWMAWRAAATEEFLGEKRAEGVDVEAFGDYIHADTQRLLQMLEVGRKLMSAFGSMHWTLVEFPTRVIVTSDHPIVQWPAGVAARKPAPTPHSVGVMENLEVRVPVAPDLAIVMTWRDLPDDDPNRISGKRQHAANLNAFTIAEADRQWYHHPSSATPTTSGSLMPLAPQLFPGYGIPVAIASRRRERAATIMQALVGVTVEDDLFEIVSIRRGVVEQRARTVANDGEDSSIDE